MNGNSLAVSISHWGMIKLIDLDSSPLSDYGAHVEYRIHYMLANNSKAPATEVF